MAVKVKDSIQIEKIEGRKYTFFLPWPDVDVQRMLVRNGHTISLIKDNPWDIALFTGGADVCPLLYGEKMHDTSYINVHRDLIEIAFYMSLHKKRMKVGICRGAQLLNVLSGGRLYQHVNMHGNSDGHLVKIWNSDDLIRMTSRHHQMMIVASDACLLSFARESTHKISEAFGDKQITQPEYDPEIVYYESTHSLCFQPHPEDENAEETTKAFFDMIDMCWSDIFKQEALE